MTISEQHLTRWQDYLTEAKADQGWVDWMQHLTALRLNLCTELKAFLDSYLNGEISTQDFQSTFDRKTRKEWEGFGMKGASGAMFLNMLVKHIPDKDGLTQQLKQALPVPDSPEMAAKLIKEFSQFLEGEIASGQVTRRQIQPARCLFLLSVWWHVQAVEQWPVFYLSARRMLEKEGLYSSQNDLAQDYLTLRDAFIAMASALDLRSWEFEQLCTRIENAKTEPPTSPEAATTVEVEEKEAGEDVVVVAVPVGDGPVEPEGEENQGTHHTHVQWMLAKIGRKLGCKVWIARNDRSRVWNGETLGSLSIDSLPALGMGGTSQRIIELIDVVWLRAGKQVSAAFEVECTTSIYSGLLRMSDLGALSPNLNFPFYIVAPKSRIDKVRKELSRPTFQMLELHNRCGYFASESLQNEFENIIRWATDASAIESLASKVADISEEN
ncbi:MAG: hypothetical protein O2890_07130 [Cyanobacteria bacterium]|nr:hypothetical protein [Cyanobacteriota bacterium]MDA0866179.1 hypothetical protein [Cyanobacteriota bacterium]